MVDRPLQFVVDAEISQLGIPVASVLICGLDNSPSAQRGGERSEQNDSRWALFSREFIKIDPVLRGYRELHSAVGRSNKRFVSSTEALIQAFLRTQSLPRISPAVDIYYRLSLETLLSIGAHDAAKISDDVFFRLTDGSERFVPLRSAEAVAIAPGEYGYVDSANDLLCRMECRQAEKSKLDARSTDCVFIVQGNANTRPADVQQTLELLIERVTERCGGDARPLHDAVA